MGTKRVIIIGGGLGGLTTGAFLAKEGFAVTVLEKNKVIGGGLHCFRHKGVFFETGMHIIGGFMPDRNLHKICKYLGIMDKLKIRHTDEDCIDSIYFHSDNKTYFLPRGKKAFGFYLTELFPDQFNGISNYLNALWQIADDIDVYNLRPVTDNFFLKEYSENFLMPVDRFIAKYISDPKLAEILAYMNPLYGGVAGHTPTFIHAMINVMYINGSSMFVDGSQQMADALAEVIISGGGSVINNDAVSKIEISDREITQVITENGNAHHGDIYISSIHPCSLLDLMPRNAFPNSFRNRIDEIPNSYSAFSVYIKFKNGTRQAYVNHPRYYIQKHGIIWQLGKFDEASFPTSFLCITPPTENQGEWADRMTVTCPMPFDAVARWADSKLNSRSQEYESWKAAMLDKVLAKLEFLCPGIHRDIEFCFASSPLTIRDFYGTKNGSMFGFNHDCNNMALSYIPMATKIRNLLLTGQNVFLHGICGVSLTSLLTAECLVGKGRLIEKINNFTD